MPLLRKPSMLINFLCLLTFLTQALAQTDRLNFFEKRSSTSNNSSSLQEWAPVESSLIRGEKAYFQFNIDNEETYSQFLQSYQMFIFLSANIYGKPNNTEDDVTLRAYYSFDISVKSNWSTAEQTDFNYGYMEALALRPYSWTNDTYSTLYLMVQLVNQTTGEAFEQTSNNQEESWSYTISISRSDLVFQWDLRSWLEVVDSDYNSALLVTGNVTSTTTSEGGNTTLYNLDLYDIYVYDSAYTDYFENLDLSRSLSAIQRGPYLVSSADSNSVSAAENSSLSSTTLAAYKSITSRGGSVKEQFHITGLNSSTTYIAYLTKKLSSNSSTVLKDEGGILFGKQEFTTIDTQACSLIFGLDFCDGVAYSVPSSSLIEYSEKLELASIYDNIAETYYGNFSYALQLISCDTENDAIYSPLRTCSDCASSYKNWLCSVSIPRCTANESTYYQFRSTNESRNDMLDELVSPASDYYEILPCIDTCRAMVRDCPPDFSFSCPSLESTPDLLYLSYNVYDSNVSFSTCNFVGNKDDLKAVNPT